MRMLLRLVGCLVVCVFFFGLSGMTGSRPVVGTILSTGSFRLDHIAGSGTATVLNGDVVETLSATSRILLRSGVDLNLSPRSGGTVYGDHATLAAGTLRIQSRAGEFPVDSKAFVVRPSPGTDAILQVAGNTLTVNVTAGSAQIASVSGQTLAHLAAGVTLAFDSLGAGVAGDPGGESSVHLLGVLDEENGHYLVRDRFTNSVSEVQGQVSPKLLNHLVAVDGKSFTNEKSSVFQVDRLVRVSKLASSDAAFGLPCAVDGVGGIARMIMLSGVLSKVRDHFLVQDKKSKTYEVVGDVSDKEVGSNIHEKGFILPSRPSILPAEGVVYLERKKLILMASPCVGAMVGSSLVTTGAVAAIPATANAAQATPISF